MLYALALLVQIKQTGLGGKSEPCEAGLAVAVVVSFRKGFQG